MSTGSDKLIRFWDIETKVPQPAWIAKKAGVSCVSFISSNLLAFGDEDGKIRIWGIDANNKRQTLNSHTKTVRCIIRLNNELIASGSDDGTIKLWDYKKGSSILSSKSHQVDDYNVSFEKFCLVGSGYCPETFLFQFST